MIRWLVGFYIHIRYSGYPWYTYDNADCGCKAWIRR